MNFDLEFISGRFFDFELPRGQRYLLKYFRTDIQRQFVRYYCAFGNVKYFVEHTGRYCKKRWLQLLSVRLNLLEEVLKKARAEMNLETVALIESGRFKFARYQRGEYDC